MGDYPEKDKGQFLSSPMRMEQQYSNNSSENVIELSDDGDDEIFEEKVESKQEEDDDQTRYDVMTLIGEQSKFLYIDWRDPKYKSIPRSARFVNKGVHNEEYMRNVVAMFMRKSSNPWLPPSHVGAQPTDKKNKMSQTND